MFYDRLKEICASKRTSPSAVALAVGMSKSNVTGWRKGQSPTWDTVQKIAAHLNVDVSIFEEPAANPDKCIEKPATPKDDELVDAIIMSRDGKTIRRKYTKEQSDHLKFLLDSIPYVEDEEL